MKKRFRQREVDAYPSISELVYDILEAYDVGYGKKSFDGVNVICPYHVAIQIINRLVAETDFELYDIELCNPDICEYGDVYILSIDVEAKIWCERICGDNGYLSLDNKSAIYFADYRVSEDFIDKTSNVDIIYFSVDDSCEDDCCEVCNDDAQDDDIIEYEASGDSVQISRKADGTPLGFSKSWSSSTDDFNYYSSYSFYSNDNSELRKIANKFGVNL